MRPYQKRKEEGYDVYIAAPSKKKLRFVVHDFEPGFGHLYRETRLQLRRRLAFADPADYVALVIPGGRTPEHIRNHEACQRIIRHFFESENSVAQLCHAPLALIAGHT
jgi:protease I